MEAPGAERLGFPFGSGELVKREMFLRKKKNSGGRNIVVSSNSLSSKILIRFR